MIIMSSKKKLTATYLATDSPNSHYTVGVAFPDQGRHVGPVLTIPPRTVMGVIEVSMTLIHKKMVHKTLVTLLDIWFELV